MLKIKNLTLKFNDRFVFKDFNINIEKNKITAITGHSGIGKTSLFLCINQMIRYEKSAKINGEIFYNFDGKVRDLNLLQEKDLPRLRKEIIYVSQHPDLLPCSIYENLAFFARIYKFKNPKDEIIKALKKVYLYDEVKDKLNLDASSLSGGQQQRLILARAFLLNPKVLLLDEPTASLDEELTLKIENMLRKEDKTIAIISHFKSQINNLADTIYEI